MRGSYECLTLECVDRGIPWLFDWDAAWPLPKRQKHCAKCGERMLLISIKKEMSEQSKQKLKAFIARRKKDGREAAKA